MIKKRNAESEGARTNWNSVLQHVVSDSVLGKRHVLRDRCEASNIVVFHEGAESCYIPAGFAEFVNRFGKVLHRPFCGAKGFENFVVALRGLLGWTFLATHASRTYAGKFMTPLMAFGPW